MTTDADPVPVAKPAAPVEPAGFEVTVDVTEEMRFRLLNIQFRALMLPWPAIAVLGFVGYAVWQIVSGQDSFPTVAICIPLGTVWGMSSIYHSHRKRIHMRRARFGDWRVHLRISTAGVEASTYRLQSGKIGECFRFERTFWPEFVQLRTKSQFWLLYTTHVNLHIMPTPQLSDEQKAFIEGCARTHGVKVVT